MWLGILASVLAATAAGAVYMIFSVGKFGAVKKLSGGKKWASALISFAIIGAVFAAVAFAMSAVNAVIVFLVTVLFFLLYGLIMRIIKAAGGREPEVNWQGWLALVSSAVYLVTGYYLLHHVWRTGYSLTTEKDIAPLRIAVFADSHLSTTFGGDGFAEHIEEIKKQSPDLVLIPGDYVDDGTKREDMVRACEALGTIDARYGVWFSYGNHDPGYYGSRGFTAEELEAELKKNGIGVLADEVTEMADICLIGRKDASASRMDIASLAEGIDRSMYIIVMDHQPNDYANEADAGADLVVSGHTHGGQLFPVTYVGEWIGANDRTYGHEKRGNTDFIVTSGIADWEIQFKTGTKSEYVIIDVAHE